MERKRRTYPTQGPLDRERKETTAAAVVELARRHPGFARACGDRLDPAAQRQLVAELMNPRPLRPLAKARPRSGQPEGGRRPTELSLHLSRYAQLLGNVSTKMPR